MQFPVSIELRRSRFLSLLLFLIHALAASCLVVLPWVWPFRLLLLALVGASLWHALRSHVIVGLCINGRDRLDGLIADGIRVPLAVQPDSTVFDRLIVLRLRVGEQKRISHLALLPDQMSAEHFRVLRLWLRWHSEPKKVSEGIV